LAVSNKIKTLVDEIKVKSDNNSKLIKKLKLLSSTKGKSETNVLGIISLVLGVLAFPALPLALILAMDGGIFIAIIVPPLFALAAIILGAKGMKSSSNKSSKRMARTGLILGIVFWGIVIIFALIALLLIALLASSF
jgi:hypothetical protein